MDKKPYTNYNVLQITRTSFEIMTWLALRPAAFARVPATTTCRPGVRLYSGATTGAGRVSDPLRILFCGSDDFSCAALTALTVEKKRNPALIESLEVVVRPSKLSGRGMKNVREGMCAPPRHS